jgi:hypothetical protein
MLLHRQRGGGLDREYNRGGDGRTDRQGYSGHAQKLGLAQEWNFSKGKWELERGAVDWRVV